MYYILCNDIALCSYKDKKYSIWRRYEPLITIIDEDTYNVLDKCDGLHSLKVSDPMIQSLENDNIIEKCEFNSKKLDKWQKVKTNNIYLHELEIAITYKCNMNCLHCFTTSSASHLMPELSLEDYEKILDDAVKCGIHGIHFTGGEPMLHPNIKEMIKMIYKKGLYLYEFCTNGSLLTEEFIKWLSILPNAKNIQFDISFDMVGYHDWLRNKNGAEKEAINAMKLCKKYGFIVMTNCNINKVNSSSMYDTVNLLESIGVDKIRLISTRRSPKWIELCNGKEYDWTEWYDLAIEFAKRYTNEEHTAELDFWSTFHFKPKDRIVDTNSIRGSRCKCDETQALCSLIRRRIAVCPDGDINICHQMTGALKKDGRCLGNVIKDGLSKVLEDSEYQRIIEAPVSKRKEFNKECQECEYWNYCVGGCPVMGHEHHKEFTESPFPYYYDYSKCVFFKNDYYHKLASILPMDWVLL